VEIAQASAQLKATGAVVLVIGFEVLEAENLVHLLPRRTAELFSLFGRNSTGQIGLLDLDITSQLIGLQVANEVVGERDDALHSMAQLGVVEMVQQVAHLQLGALGHLHGEQALAVLILTL